MCSRNNSRIMSRAATEQLGSANSLVLCVFVASIASSSGSLMGFLFVFYDSARCRLTDRKSNFFDQTPPLWPSPQLTTPCQKTVVSTNKTFVPKKPLVKPEGKHCQLTGLVTDCGLRRQMDLNNELWISNVSMRHRHLLVTWSEMEKNTDGVITLNNYGSFHFY